MSVLKFDHVAVGSWPGQVPPARRAPPPHRLPGRTLVAAPQPFFSARGTPIATRYLTQALCELGTTVDLLTYPIGDDLQIDRMRLVRSRNPLGYRSIPMGFSGRKVVLDLPFMTQLRQLLWSNDYDVVHASEEAAFFLALTGVPRGCAFVYDMQSSIPHELDTFGGLVGRFARAVERQVLERADMVVCSAGLGPLVAQTAPSVAYREWVFPAEPCRTSNPAEVMALHERLQIAADAVVVLYAGSFAHYQNTQLMADAVPSVLASSERVHFIFAGFADGAEEDAFVARLGAAARSRRVSLVRRVPCGELERYKALANVLLSCRGSVRNVPLKVFELLAAGKPIVANEVPAHQALLDPSLAMLVPSTPEGFASGILRLVEDPALGRRLAGKAAALAAKRLCWPSFCSLVADIYDGALRSRLARTRSPTGLRSPELTRIGRADPAVP